MGLKFYLLGPPQVTWNDAVLEMPRRQVRILLYYLASYPHAVPQERLHYLFWSDKSEAECRRNMSHLLTHARLSLPEKDVLIVKDSLIMLDPKRIWCDVVEFKRLIQSTQKDDRLTVFKQAAEYYRGPFLDGLQFANEKEFEDLIELERFNLERNYLNLLYKLLLIEKQNGNYEFAIEYAYQYLRRDNLAEDVHRQLIVLFGLTGRREQALRQYKNCEDLLQRELQTKPSIKTQLAYQNVLSYSSLGEYSMPINETLRVRPQTIGPLFVNSNSYDQFMNLVDRGPHADRCGVAMLHGELGIGKSSLLTKALSEIGRERLIIRARCDPAINSLSYWPVKNLILRECRAHSSTSQMISEFFSKEGSFSDAFQINTEEILLGKFSKDNQFSFLVKCLLSLANEPGGLILCVEDLEWADADTLELFLYLSRYTQSNKILLIGSYCCPESNNLTIFIPKLQMADGLLGTIKVQGVSEKETGSIVKMWIGDLKADPSFITHLHRLSGGNPLFISEILRWISESGISADSLMNDTSLSLPSTISKIINYRLSRLNQIDRRVLEVGAAIGHIFKIDQVSELSDLSVLQILDALDELVNRHFLLPQSTQYQFAHELIRLSVLNDMNPVRRKFLEERCLGEQR